MNTSFSPALEALSSSDLVTLSGGYLSKLSPSFLEEFPREDYPTYPIDRPVYHFPEMM